MTERSSDKGRYHSLAALIPIGLLAFVAFLCLVWLGTWQLQRRVWKLDLIDRVEHRVHALPRDPPTPDAASPLADEYRHVQVGGVFSSDHNTLVQAVTDLGGGYWVMTPLSTDAGFTVLVNRGFVPSEQRARFEHEAATSDHVMVTGLVRLTEPKGGFLRTNDPNGGHWYSRDVQAISAARGITNVAPYFIDADATPNPGGWPVGGLTVLTFRNNHLVYALTWYSLALMVAGGMVVLIRGRRSSPSR